MSVEAANEVAKAVLYEGYILYPYRRSAVKNQQRWNFGVLYPRAYAEAQSGHDAWSMQTECLALIGEDSQVTIRARFLQLVTREIGRLETPVGEWPEKNDLRYSKVDSLETSAERFQSWQEAIERDVILPASNIQDLESTAQRLEFSFPEEERLEAIRERDEIVGLIIRRNETVAGEIVVSAEREGDALCKIRVQLINQSHRGGQPTDREAALSKSLLSAHAVLSLENAEFISLLDPPNDFRSAAAACSNVGCWPVLVGSEPARDTMLASPIILYDYPQIAQASAGDLFDGTEIDEILSLRIMTLTDEEKREMRSSDERARRILERTEALPAEQFMKMHGVLKNLEGD